MKLLLNKIHNVMMNCHDNNELQTYLFTLLVDSKVNTDTMISILKSSTLAINYSVLPIYYFKASTTTNMKQDRNGNFYKA